MKEQSPKQQANYSDMNPGVETDQLEEAEVKEEAANEDYMEVTSLIIDRMPRR